MIHFLSQAIFPLHHTVHGYHGDSQNKQERMTFQDGNVSFLVAGEQQLQPPLNSVGNKSTLCSEHKEYCYCVSNHVSQIIWISITQVNLLSTGNYAFTSNRFHDNKESRRFCKNVTLANYICAFFSTIYFIGLTKYLFTLLGFSVMTRWGYSAESQSERQAYEFNVIYLARRSPPAVM